MIFGHGRAEHFHELRAENGWWTFRFPGAGNFFGGRAFSSADQKEIFRAKTEWDSAAYRERALMAQKRAAEAPTEGLKTLWLELAERYFELADQVLPEAELRFPHKLQGPGSGGRILL
jgi:hypothetical protein